MTSDSQAIFALLKNQVHPDSEEVAGYIDGSLVPAQAASVAEHISNCHYCARELELLKEPGDTMVTEAFDSSQYLSVTTVPQTPPNSDNPFTKLWLGENSYVLKPADEYTEFWEPLGLFLPELLRARRSDLQNPDSCPLAIEASGRVPVIAPLGSFDPVGDFEVPETIRPLDATEGPETVMRFFVPVLLDTDSEENERETQVIREIHESCIPMPNPILSRLCQDRLVEICREADSEKVFLRITQY